MAQVVACSRALYKLRKYHPDWQVPPLPLNGSTQVQWNWVELLEGKTSTTYVHFDHIAGGSRLTRF